MPVAAEVIAVVAGVGAVAVGAVACVAPVADAVPVVAAPTLKFQRKPFRPIAFHSCVAVALGARIAAVVDVVVVVAVVPVLVCPRK